MSDLNAAVGVEARTHPDGLADGPSKIARGIHLSRARVSHTSV